MSDHKNAGHKDVERLSFFTDGVIVITMTLLVLDLRLPALSEHASETDLALALLSIWPNYFAYALSFVVIASFWMNHVRRLRGLVRVDSGLLWLNVLFLMLIGVVPFVTSVLAEHGGRVGTQAYALVMGAVAATLTGMIAWAHRRGLMETQATGAERWRSALRGFSTAAIFLISIGIAAFDADYARYFWLLLIPAQVAAGRAPLSST